MCRLFLIRRSAARLVFATLVAFSIVQTASAAIGVGAPPLPGADVLIDGSRARLDEKWTYWEGPRFASSLPIKWQIVEDPVDPGTALMTADPAAAGGKYGAADIITKDVYRDFRLHIEFLVMNPDGNSGVYLQNRYEIQICDGDRTTHGMGAVINETPSPYSHYLGLGKWNAYDIVFRAARFKDGQRSEPALVTVYFNGVKVHANQAIQQVWGGPNSGLDGGNDRGKGITDVPGPLKLQAEGHDVRFRNAWIMPLTLDAPDTALPDAPEASQRTGALAPALPGKGLAQHDFLYAGEAKNRRAFIVRGGQVVWTYDDPAGRGEISDATLLSNGNLLLAHQFAVKLVSPDKKVLWNLDAPADTEIHTAQMIGREHVLFVQNGNPALLKVVNITTGETRREFPLPVGNPKGVHGQFRNARLTPAGTLLVAHMDLGKVCEYDATGKELWSVPAEGAWGVQPLPNGHVLITGRRGVHEVTRGGDTVWAFNPADVPEFPLQNLQLAWRLANGNTLLNNWASEWGPPIDKNPGPIQALELTPDKKVVWALRSWSDPDLGPATTIQILDTPVAPETATFGDIR